MKYEIEKLEEDEGVAIHMEPASDWDDPQAQDILAVHAWCVDTMGTDLHRWVYDGYFNTSQNVKIKKGKVIAPSPAKPEIVFTFFITDEDDITNFLLTFPRES